LAGRSCGASQFLTGFTADGQLSCGQMAGASGNAPVLLAFLNPQQAFLTFSRVDLSLTAFDADGDAVGFETNFLTVPPLSHAQLTNVFTPHPNFVPDVPGLYVLTAVAIDPAGHRSAPVETDVLIAACSTTPPALVFDGATPVAVGQLTTITFHAQALNGGTCGIAASRIEFSARFVSVPPQAQLDLIGATTGTPSFIPPVPGLYAVAVMATQPLLGTMAEQAITIEVP